MSVDSSTTTADLSRLVAVARASGPDQLDELCVNTIRTLSMDTVHSANSGHPGTPTALAPVAYYLWQRFLRYDPNDPIWPNRDRFVLSVDHASMLLYSLLHLSRGKVVSKASGVEPKTGPLGQGVANSVGKAIAGKWMAARYNQPGFEDFIDFNVYALCDDSCMMEAVTGEAASLAGRLKLSNLCWIYDNNQITTGRNTALPFREDVITSFLGYGWNVTRVRDANDPTTLERAFRTFLSTQDRPTLIIVDRSAHGEPLTEAEFHATTRNHQGPQDAKSYIPQNVYDHFKNGIGKRGGALRDAWFARVKDYHRQYPRLAEELCPLQHRRFRHMLLPRTLQARRAKFSTAAKEQILTQPSHLKEIS